MCPRQWKGISRRRNAGRRLSHGVARGRESESVRAPAFARGGFQMSMRRPSPCWRSREMGSQ
eukprot:5801247-Lingulodinium_polyedra.AAC.1